MGMGFLLSHFAYTPISHNADGLFVDLDFSTLDVETPTPIIYNIFYTFFTY